MGALKNLLTCFFPSVKPRKDILVDASTMQIYDIIPRILSKIEEGYRFVITRTNRIELSLLSTYEKPDQSSKNARAYLNLEKLYPNSFISVNDKSPLTDPDSRLIAFGALNGLEFWTSDGGARDRATDLGYKVEFLNSNKLKSNFNNEKKTGTFWQAKLEGSSLVLSNKQQIRSITIIRGRTVYQNPENGFQLKLGDQVLVCIKKTKDCIDKEYVAFAAYTIISIAESENVNIDFTHQFYDRSEPYTLKNAVYTAAVINYIDKYLPNFPKKCNKPLDL